MPRPTPTALGLAAAALAAGALAACSAHTASSANSTPPGEPESVKIGSVRWLTDLEAARELARAGDKPLWLHFGEHPG